MADGDLVAGLPGDGVFIILVVLGAERGPGIRRRGAESYCRQGFFGRGAGFPGAGGEKKEGCCKSRGNDVIFHSLLFLLIVQIAPIVFCSGIADV